MNERLNIYPEVDRWDIPDNSIIIGDGDTYYRYTPIKDFPDICAYVSDLLHSDSNREGYFSITWDVVYKSHRAMLAKILRPGNNFPIQQGHFTYIRKEFLLSCDEVYDCLDTDDAQTLREWLESEVPTDMPIMSKELYNLSKAFIKAFSESENKENNSHQLRSLFFKAINYEKPMQLGKPK